MQDDDINIVIRLVKKAVQRWPAPLMERLAKSEPDPFAILIACVLSLRTRDHTTEQASTQLFALANDPFSMASLPIERLEKAIFPVGFYPTKSRQIHELSRQICQDFQGRVPENIQDLMKLPGVGRKTANLVRTVGFKKPGICVDIHVHRICNRLGYVDTKSPNETEFSLRKKLPKKHWISLNRLLVSFGQNQCAPISPRCDSCLLDPYCQRKGVVIHR